MTRRVKGQQQGRWEQQRRGAWLDILENQPELVGEAQQTHEAGGLGGRHQGVAVNDPHCLYAQEPDHPQLQCSQNAGANARLATTGPRSGKFSTCVTQGSGPGLCGY